MLPHLPETRRLQTAGSLLCLVLVAACASSAPLTAANQHLGVIPAERSGRPAPSPVLLPPVPPPPSAEAEVETYSVVVNKVEVHDLLFALARDARINVDIHAGIVGQVTLNAVEQTLPQLLKRICRQVDMRFEIDGQNLVVMPDTPFLRNYPVDYVNMARETTGSLAVATQLVGMIGGGTDAGPAVTATGNNSTTRIENRTQHRFWETLVQNVKDILRETDKILPEGSSETVVEEAQTQRTTGTGSPPGNVAGKHLAVSAPASLATSPNAAMLQNAGSTLVRKSTFREAASVIAHPETGIVAVRATSRQHEKVREFLEQIQAAAKRQVMIEATLVEVQLANNYQQGIDWSRVASATGFGLALSGQVAAAPGLFAVSYRNDGLSAMIKLLDTFGTTRVLSSPKLSVLNNQTAVLKVVDNNVYFTIKADTTQNQTTTITTYTTTLNQVPVGFVMNVTPQINETDTVLLNVRPSVSRIIGTVRDPNPALKKSTENAFAEDIISEIPIIRTREMESMLRIQDGHIAVMGGLMEDSLHNKDSFIPGLARVPMLGEALAQRNDTATKSELVVFLRPTIIRHASIDGDYAPFGEYLPAADFFAESAGPHAIDAPPANRRSRR